jgi:hypothetical protein
VESAKKLRFYDKADLEALIRVQAQEKAELYGTVNALRQVWCPNHIHCVTRQQYGWQCSSGNVHVLVLCA